MDYTERMRDLLAQRGMTQAELAAKSKTKQQTVSGWLRSKDVNTRVIGIFCKALGMQVEDFFITPEYAKAHFNLSPEAYALPNLSSIFSCTRTLKYLRTPIDLITASILPPTFHIPTI